VKAKTHFYLYSLIKKNKSDFGQIELYIVPIGFFIFIFFQ